MTTRPWLPLFWLPLLMTTVAALTTASARAAPTSPDYLPDGRLVIPEDYREWIFLTSGLDMSYLDKASMAGHSMFDNVFTAPDTYREFKQTGTWPDRTLLVKEVRGASSKGSINKHGKFQTIDRMEIEVHVKDTARFAGGWAFFVSSGSEPATLIPESAECYACHRQHGAVDTTFVQFYPTLLSISTEKGTLAPGYKP